MISIKFRTMALCTATALASAVVFAQTPDASTGGAASGPTKPADKMFLQKAALGGLAEIQLGQLAAQKGSSDGVKKFGQQMVDDHTALNEQMKPFVEAAGLTTPTKLAPKDQAEYDKLNGLSGADFDKEYVSYMQKDHHTDLKEFRKEEATTKNASLKDAVAKGETVIMQHTEMVDKMAKDKSSTATM